MGRFGPSRAGATAEPAAADLSTVQVLNTWALVALNVTRLWSRLSSPSTPLCGDHGFHKLVRSSSSSTGQETKTGGKSESLDIAGAWRSMLANDYMDDHISWPPRSTCPAFISSSASAPHRRAAIPPPQAAASFVQQVAVKQFVATCDLQAVEGPSSVDSFSLPTCLLPSHDHSCSPPAHASQPWVALLGQGTPAASDTDAASFSSSRALTPLAAHTSSSSNDSSGHHVSTRCASVTATASQAGGPFLPRPDLVRLEQAHAPSSPADLECTALASSVLVEVRSMLRAMGAYPVKGIIIPAGAPAPLANATSCSAPLPSTALPLYNAALSAQLGPGAAVGRGGFGSVYSGVWEDREVAIKRVPFTAVPAQRSALRNALQPLTDVDAGCPAAQAAPRRSWRLPNGILMECAHAMVLGGGCSSVSFDGAVSLRTWSICPLPPAAGVDGGSGHTHELLLVMPLLKRSLDQALQQHLSPADALSAAHDVVLAVASLHAHGTIHGDIKCGNCMVDPHTGAWLLLDFGLAATLKGNMRSAAARGSSQGHAAPELLAEGRISAATDVYAAGVMLHRLLTHKSVTRGAPAWWSEAVVDAAAAPPAAAAWARASARLPGSAERDGCRAVTHLLQLLVQAQADSPSARPSMPQLCEAVQAAVEAAAVVWLAPEHGSTACGTDGSSGTGGHSLDAAASAEHAMQESSSPTFSTITTDPNWSSMSSEPIDEDLDDAAGLGEGDVMLGSCSSTSGGA
ncbi:MAG: hypothetical protein WDW36_008693 [Sanguina aurantia]